MDDQAAAGGMPPLADPPPARPGDHGHATQDWVRDHVQTAVDAVRDEFRALLARVAPSATSAVFPPHRAEPNPPPAKPGPARASER